MTDAYEREHMAGIGEVLHREKAVLPRWALGLVVGLPLALGSVAAAGVAIGGAMLSALAFVGGAAALSLLMAGLMVTFATARLVVSEGELLVQLGFAGPRVPIAEITRVHVGPSGIRRWGIGFKKLLGGRTIVSMLGDDARAVHVERTDGTRLVLVTREPEALHAALEEALRRRDAKLPRVRVAPVPDDERNAVAEAETNADANARREGREQAR